MDEADIAQHEITSTLNHYLSKRESNKINKNQIREGKDVICRICGEKINKKRLKAIPDAVYCVMCQEEIESGRIIDEE